ncbi:hypothetical protein BSK66_32265 [Paenibacillus odorifer]|uniref:hypothetical protein n=1 Tax=Paenibacillus TaxID=44249 RepID=UPI0003E29474|nr:MULTISPECIES: hypothetical protein [Paenibacillus]ETT56276.1 hypothetical protein C171_18777 [Paenibacillus sp. FSL H8-237]OMD07802.1 hypothetical protein BJP47_30220 [Paenibacillus odorifer]OME46228.1 hypothetical protein BSK66_32265 [Paenibacillus odorifer]
MAARKSGIADYCGLSRILSVETRYIFLDGNLIGEIIYDKEDTRYYSIWIQVDEKRFYEFDLKRKNAIGRALAKAGIQTDLYPANAPHCDN